MIKLCLAVLIIHFIQLFTADRIADQYHWIIWDGALLTNAILYSLALLMSMSYSELRGKVLVTFLLVYNTWLLLEYLILTVLESYIDIGVTRNITALISMFIFFPLLVRIVYQKYTQSSDEYKDTPGNCYLVYRSPKSFQGLLAALIYDIAGSVYLVVGGKQFKYKRGVILEGKHKLDENGVYRRIKFVTLKQARELKGRKWSLRNNCFRVFNRFK